MNKLNVFGYGFWPARCVFHNTKAFFRNIKYAWQRVTKGYCDYDVWDLEDFYTKLFINSLGDFVKDLHSLPPDFEEEEDWIERINEIRQHFINSEEDPESYKKNPDELFEELAYREKELKIALEMLSKVYTELWD